MTKLILAASAVAFFYSFPAGAAQEAEKTPPINGSTFAETLRSFSNEGEVQLAAMCTSAGEELNGSTKTCFYSCPTGTKAMTVSAGSLCPISIDG